MEYKDKLLEMAREKGEGEPWDFPLIAVADVHPDKEENWKTCWALIRSVQIPALDDERDLCKVEMLETVQSHSANYIKLMRDKGAFNLHVFNSIGGIVAGRFITRLEERIFAADYVRTLPFMMSWHKSKVQSMSEISHQTLELQLKLVSHHVHDR